MLVVLLLASGCENSKPKIEWIFSTSEHLWEMEGKNPSYIADISILPKAAKTCEVNFLGINGAVSDGGEAAYFETSGRVSDMIQCLKKTLPGNAITVSQEEWNELKLAYPSFPMSLENYRAKYPYCCVSIKQPSYPKPASLLPTAN